MIRSSSWEKPIGGFETLRNQQEERVRVARVTPLRQRDIKEIDMRGTLGLIVLIILVVIALRFFGII